LFHGGATDQELARSVYPASVGKAKEVESVWFPLVRKELRGTGSKVATVLAV